MAKKKTALSGLNDTLFQGIDPYAQNATSVDAMVSTLPLTAIFPDLSQPRRLLPSDLRQALATGLQNPSEVLQEWEDRVGSLSRPKAQDQKLTELRQLAESIAQHGLINPLTVREPRPGEMLPAGVGFVVVTGERRYWAHVYLANHNQQIQEGDTARGPADVKAVVVGEGVSIRAHQLIENLMREDINAVEKALGFLALRYELSGVNYSSPTAESGVPKSGRSAEKGLVPWREVETALGISKRYRIFVSSVLNLSEEAQELVAAHSLAEMTIRPVTQKLKDHPDLQLEVLKQVISWQQEEQGEHSPGRRIVASVRELVEQLLAARTGQGDDTQPNQGIDTAAMISSGADQARLLRTKARTVLRFLDRLPEPEQVSLTQALQKTEQAELIAELHDLRSRIDNILTAVTEQDS